MSHIDRVNKKDAKNFVGQKSETHPIQPEKGETGCVLGAGGDENGWGRVQPDEKTQCPNQSEHHSHATHAKRKPAKTQCFRRFCGRGSRDRFAAERHRRSLTPRHALRGAQPYLVAKSYCTLTKKSGTAEAIPDFLAGAEGLGSSAGSGAAPRWGAPSTDRGGSQGRRGSATGTHCPFGTRFCSGCGNTIQGPGEGQAYPVLPDKSQKSGAGLALREIFGAKTNGKSSLRHPQNLRESKQKEGFAKQNLKYGKETG